MDGNQQSIVDDLRKIPGCSVQVLSAVGHGCPDILVGYRGANLLFELKDPTKPKADQALTEDQQAFHASWHGQVKVAHSFLDIVKFMGGV